MIVTFLALLEMIRLRRVRAIQPGSAGAIRIYRVTLPAADVPAPAPPAAAAGPADSEPPKPPAE
jgi:hypothetical protein